MRLKAISRKLSEINPAAIHDEADMLEVIVWAMLRKLEGNRPARRRSPNVPNTELKALFQRAQGRFIC